MADKENGLKKKIRPVDLSTFEIPALQEMYMCTRCTKSYRLRHSLTRHIKFECGQEPKYACALCPKKFKHKYDLHVHERGKHSIVRSPKRGKKKFDGVLVENININNTAIKENQ